jgi:AcrR family transcriptional regulator
VKKVDVHPVTGAEKPLRADARRNRERLLEAAAAAFSRDGATASLEDIARQAGVGVGTLYRHFPNRELLMEAIFRRDVTALTEGAHQLLDEMPPDEALAEFMQRFVAYVANKKGLATHLKSVLSEDAELFAYTHAQMNAAIGELLQAAVDAGRIRGDVAGTDVLRALSGVCLASDAPGWQDQACRISRLLMDGLRYHPQDA